MNNEYIVIAHFKVVADSPEKAIETVEHYHEDPYRITDMDVTAVLKPVKVVNLGKKITVS